MSDYYGKRKPEYLEKEQVLFKVFGCGSDVKLLSARVPAGTPYDDRVQVFQLMDKEIKECGGKCLKSGYWTATPLTSDPSPEIELSDSLPF